MLFSVTMEKSKKMEALDDVVEEMPVVNALAAFLKYLDVRSAAKRIIPALTCSAASSNKSSSHFSPHARLPFLPCDGFFLRHQLL